MRTLLVCLLLLSVAVPPASAELMAPSQAEIVREAVPGGTNLYLVNRTPARLSVKLALAPGAVNTRLTTRLLPCWISVPPNTRQFLFTASPVDPSKDYVFSIQGTYIRRATLEPNHVYGLPYRTTASQTAGRVSLTQGWNNPYSHNGTSSRYAVDFSMQEGTPVVAARAGTVVDLDEDFSGSGLSSSWLGRENFVAVRHDDGTVAKYLHLMTGGVVVRVGQTVRRGQHLGYSGNTGYSSGPHLHFVVYANENGKISIPVRFAGFSVPDGDPASTLAYLARLRSYAAQAAGPRVGR